MGPLISLFVQQYAQGGSEKVSHQVFVITSTCCVIKDRFARTNNRGRETVWNEIKAGLCKRDASKWHISINR